MAYDAQLAERVRIIVRRRRGFTEMKLFGGVGFLWNGKMCAAIWKEWLIVRLGAKQSGWALSQPFVKEFDVTGRVMTGWAMVAPEATDDDDALRDWFDRAARFVRGLPPKADSPSRPRRKSSRRKSS